MNKITFNTKFGPVILTKKDGKVHAQLPSGVGMDKIEKLRKEHQVFDDAWTGKFPPAAPKQEVVS